MNSTVIIWFKMRLGKGHCRWIKQRTVLYTCLLLFFGLINPGIPEVRSNVCPENLNVRGYTFDIFKVSFTDFRIFGVKQDFPVHPLTKKQSASNPDSQPLSHQRFFYEGRKIIADRGPEPALIAVSAIFLDCPSDVINYIYDIPFAIFSSWNGNNARIRPPPLS